MHYGSFPCFSLNREVTAHKLDPLSHYAESDNSSVSHDSYFGFLKAIPLRNGQSAFSF